MYMYESTIEKDYGGISIANMLRKAIPFIGSRRLQIKFNRQSGLSGGIITVIMMPLLILR